ncbi:MAG: uracil phosphoribosyltransferase [Bacteroidota bacterium]|nr:uracil phosphoribosyltransferase [Bacteroidota bacterium]
MEVYNIGEQNTLLSNFISEIREINIQQDSLRFRRNLERVGEILAYEISKTLQYTSKNIKTPLGISKENVIFNTPVLATILRAGLPLHQGFLNYFDKGENTFISAYRDEKENGTFDVKVEYMSSPSLESKTIILCDPMLASGSSMVLALEALLTKGTPAHIHIAVVIASNQGIEYLSKNLPFKNCTFWVAAIDNEMTPNSYIVPGLGDAGDLAFGKKI